MLAGFTTVRAALAATAARTMLATLAVMSPVFTLAPPLAEGGSPFAAGVDFDRHDRLADHPFDGANVLPVERGSDRDRGAGQARAAGAADTVDVIFRMGRHVE